MQHPPHNLDTVSLQRSATLHTPHSVSRAATGAKHEVNISRPVLAGSGHGGKILVRVDMLIMRNV